MRRTTWIVAASFFVLSVAGCKHRHGTSPAAEQAGSSAALTTNVPASATEIAKLQAGLLAMKAPPMDGNVPPPIQNQMLHLKDALVTLTDAEMGTMPADASAGIVTQKLKAQLPPSAPEVVEAAPVQHEQKADDTTPEAGDYGGELKADVTSPLPGLLLIQEHFTIQCGEDNLLLGYSNASGNWRRILRWQAPAYREVSDAFGDWYETRILQPRRNGHPVLLVLHGTPWCTSTMSSFGVDTLELDPNRETEQAFFHASHDYRRNDDDPPAKLSSTPDGFEIRASVSDWDTDRISRKGVMRYRLAGNTFQRTLPIAMNVRESVNEWIEQMHRNEAALFTDAPAGSPLWQMWQTLTYEGKPEGAAVPFTDYGDVRACTDSAKHFQVALTSRIYTPGKKADTPGPTYYVQVEETGNGYVLHDALTAPSPMCNGRVVMAGSAN